MLTNGQKKALHVAARNAGLTDDQRRLVQRQIGGFHSAADRRAGREGFIAVMRFYEDRAGGRLPGCTAGYWAQQDDQANPTDALVHLCRKHAAALGMTVEQLDAFVAGEHMSRGACVDVETATAYWLRRLLEGLKAMARRKNIRVA